MKITITGDVGSGKSTVAKLAAKELKLKYYSTGMMFRKLAADMQISLKELGERAKADKRIDKRIDDYQKKLGQIEDDFILEGRLGFHFMPESIKICLRVKTEEAAKRIILESRSDEKFKDLAEATESIKLRRKMERERYKDLYGIDIENNDNYDLIIDTTKIPAVEVAQKIIKYAKKD
ncbi:MAG: cytidylate kinase family protein [Candidatus Nanoarchaeia archaeon]|nr:cytidylate kinase family protein [Candidatus Nanoarchaeia archaeon]MDD5053821.1 cytidylate kinase family protein [Candidatus Nanoarchaeia archaeon]MDD5499469.1 cytidylate kinase family protein [Candidatus Nanoarchaeia archaeon]